MLALCEVAGQHPGTTLEFIPEVGQFDDGVFELMGTMSRVANRPLNWNVLIVYGKNREVVEHQLAGNDLAATHGGRVVALRRDRSGRRPTQDRTTAHTVRPPRPFDRPLRSETVQLPMEEAR